MSERVLSGAPASPGSRSGTRGSFPSLRGARADPGPTRAPRPRRRRARRAAARRRELERIAAGLRGDGRSEEAEIVATGALMAADPLLDTAVTEAVMERGRSAAAALREATDEHAAIIASLPDELLAARADDVRSLGRRAARIAAGAPDATR